MGKLAYFPISHSLYRGQNNIRYILFCLTAGFFYKQVPISQVLLCLLQIACNGLVVQSIFQSKLEKKFMEGTSVTRIRMK